MIQTPSPKRARDQTQISHKTDPYFYNDIYVVVNKNGSQVTEQSSDGREYVHNSSHLGPYKRTHEIILPSFVAAGIVGGTEEEKREDCVRKSSCHRKTPNRHT